jgi:SAM-dependent methyltransferase
MTTLAKKDSADHNRQLFDSVAEEFVDLALKPAERNLLLRYGHSLSEMHMLDLGVGTGRTGYTFAPLVDRYVGFDYAPRMLERARALLHDAAELVLGDARDLSPIRESADYEGFDLVLFSFCGIDAVEHADRLDILSQVHAVLKPGGHFLFSAHSLNTLPLSTEMPWSTTGPQSLPRRVNRRRREVLYARQARRSNRELDLAAARQRGWVIFRDPAHDFQLRVYYVDPEEQVAQLHEAGFQVDAVFDLRGAEVELPYRGRDSWLDYLCSPA